MDHASNPGPPCPTCGSETKRVYSRLEFIFQLSIGDCTEWADDIMTGRKPMPTADSIEGIDYLHRTDL